MLLPLTAYADTDSFGIVLSQGCRTMIKNNITTDCPTYEEIMILYPDTSNKKILGDFGYKNGIYQRLTSDFKNAEGYYKYGYEGLMFIDPPAKLWPKLNLITISPSLDNYLLPKNKSYNSENHTLTMGHGRFVDSCRIAYIDGNNWLFLLGDTIQYLKNNCDPSSTAYDSTTTTYLKRVTHDITTSYKYKLDKWIKESKEKCKQKCFEY